MHKQQHIFSSLIILAIISSVIISCKKTDDENPVITLSEPYSEQEFAIGDTIFIKGDITDNESLHQIEVKLTKQETGETIFDLSEHPDAAAYHLDTFYVSADSVHFHYHLIIEATDHDDNKAELEYTLHWAD
jgi:hypothetical protein